MHYVYEAVVAFKNWYNKMQTMITEFDNQTPEALVNLKSSRTF